MHTHTRTHSHTQQIQIHEEKERVKKTTGPRIEPCGTPGPLGTAAAFNLFVSWVGDWLDADNETNYVKK